MNHCHKKRLANISFILCSVLLFVGCSTKENKPGIHSIDTFRNLIVDPPSAYRSAPLWDWNEQITKEGIDFQMKEFKNAGIGGVFVHPRPGLLTEYLSEEWFELFDYTVQKGKELDMKVWIYDENSYPSGFAGGHVPAEMPDSYKHGTGLRMYIRDALDTASFEEVEVVLKKEDDRFIEVTGTIESEQGKSGTYYIFEKSFPGKSPWYGGFSYVDLLYEGVTEKFLELTMTNGYEINKADFGVTLPGVFTDEPNLEAAMARGTVMRWTPDLFEVFQNRWGYDLRVNLPSLVEEVGDWKKVRHNYYELILEMFLDRWAKPWSMYCDENNLEWTGHYWEHGWPEPTHGFDEAAFYIWHQMPGVDMLGNRLDTAGLGGQFGNDRAVRELRSAANQAGRIRTLSETYGGGGWEMDFEEQKRLADWQCVLGVNFVNQHLSYYSLNGVRKFDYPPSFSYHEPWWNNYKIMGDYIGRISLATSAGEQINQTLVLQPTTSAWMFFTRKEKNPAIEEIRKGFKNFVYRLEQKHIEYDLGSENVIQTLGSIDGSQLVVGQRSYSLVVIPAEMENMDSQTVEILEEYLENGGQLVSFGLNINRVDGAVSERVKELASKYNGQWQVKENLEDQGVLQMLQQETFRLRDKTNNGMLYHQRRVLNDGQLLYVVNSHKNEGALAEASLEGKYVTRIDLFSGEEALYPAVPDEKKVAFDIELHPSGSALFIVSDKLPKNLVEELKYTEGTLVEPVSPVSVSRETDNIMMINYLDFKTSRSEKKDVYFMDALIGLFNENGVELGNPWQHKIQYKKSYLEMDSLFKEDSGFEASYHFEIDETLDENVIRNISAVVERPELWKVFVNGNEVTPLEDSYWIEKDFPILEVGSFLKKGVNTITLKAPRMHILAEVMPIYLLGDFLVKPGNKGWKITGGKNVDMGSWIEGGLPFYSQQVAYSQTFQVIKPASSAYKVKLNHWNGTMTEVWVNGEQAGVIAWNPFDLDITEFLKEGENEITVKVTGSLKNTFGFFYNDNSNWIHGPHSWNRAPEQVPPASDYYLMEYGMFEAFELVRCEPMN